MTRAHDTVGSVCRRLAPVPLERVLDLADLQTRVDRKYLVPARTFRELLTRLDGAVSVLDICGRRVFDYESVYFDTPQLLAYHQHAYGRRRRFKVRTRTYRDSEQTVLEVKSQGAREETVKDRHPYLCTDRHRLTAPARHVVADRIGDPALARQLQVSLVNRYQRATLVDLAAGSRMTCDVGLEFHRHGRHRTGPDELVVLESKTAGHAAPADLLLWRLGHRPATISKYCVGLALLDPGLPANRWNRVLRRRFGWTPG